MLERGGLRFYSGVMKTRLPALILGALLAVPVAAGGQLYRYTNSEGTVVIDDRIPSDYVSQGYEILNQQGKVVEVIPPRRTAEEALQAARTQEAETAARERDRNLLLRYSTVEDIEIARDRVLKDLQVRIRILESNRNTLSQSLASYQSEAADAERRGEQTSAAVIKELDVLQEELDSNEQRIAARRAELDEVSAGYARDIARFEEILDLVRLRQQKERGDI